MRTGRFARDPTWATLVGCVQAYRAGALPAALVGRLRVDSSTALVPAALEHGVGGLLLETYRRAELPVPAGLARELAAGAARHLRTLEDLSRVGSRLGAAGIPWLVAKGPVLAALWFGEPYLRAYDDLDVYVSPDRFADAVRALCDTGGTVLDSEEFLRRHVPGEVRISLGSGGTIDLHWQPFFYQVHARRFPYGVARMLAKARQWQSEDGTTVLVPSVPDGLVHLCLHAAVSGGGRLSWLVDVDRYLAAWPLDRRELTPSVHAWRAGMALAVVLARVDSVLGSREARRLLGAVPVASRFAASRAEGLWGSRAVDGSARTALARAAGSGPGDTAAWAGRAALARLIPLTARREVPVAVDDYYSAVLEIGGGNVSARRSAASTGSS